MFTIASLFLNEFIRTKYPTVAAEECLPERRKMEALIALLCSKLWSNSMRMGLLTAQQRSVGSLKKWFGMGCCPNQGEGEGGSNGSFY